MEVWGLWTPYPVCFFPLPAPAEQIGLRKPEPRQRTLSEVSRCFSVTLTMLHWLAISDGFASVSLCKDSIKVVAVKLWVHKGVIYWNQAPEKSLGGKTLVKCFSTCWQLSNGECGQVGALCSVPWRLTGSAEKRVQKTKRALGALLLPLCIVFLSFWTATSCQQTSPPKRFNLNFTDKIHY